MRNYNPRLELSIVPVDGADQSIECTKCPAACCREGMVLPLTPDEVSYLLEVKTGMSLLPRKERKGERPPRGHKFYRLASACGNLAVNDVTGEASCAAYENARRPGICESFETGSFACVRTQLARIGMGQDEHVGARETLPL